MNDNQKKLLLGIDLVEKLLDLVEQKVLSFPKMQSILKTILDSIEEIDFPDTIKSKINQVLKDENLTISVN